MGAGLLLVANWGPLARSCPGRLGKLQGSSCPVSRGRGRIFVWVDPASFLSAPWQTAVFFLDASIDRSVDFLLVQHPWVLLVGGRSKASQSFLWGSLHIRPSSHVPGLCPIAAARIPIATIQIWLSSVKKSPAGGPAAAFPSHVLKIGVWAGRKGCAAGAGTA